MGYSPPPHITVVLASNRVKESEVAYWVKACEHHMQKNVAPLYQMPPCGVTFATAKTYVPAQDGGLIQIVDDDGLPNAAGAHWYVGQPLGAVDLGQSAIPSRTLDHEIVEMWRNAMLDEWIEGPGERFVAAEPNDPVQRQGFRMDVNILGKTKSVVLSDFVTPAWFGLESGHSTYLQQDVRPFEAAAGGYIIWKNRDGKIEFEANKAPMSWASRKTSRTGRILASLPGNERMA